MAINIKFDLTGNPEPPTIILANRNGNKLGQLKVNEDSIDLNDKLNDASEFSFTVNKYVDDKMTPLWDKIVDFKLVYCKEWDLWFEITVELDEETETVKTVFCTQLGQAELSQITLYNIEINTEEDIERDDYKISILWDKSDPKASILNRTLEKAPHYSIVYVDPTIAKIQRSFSFDGTSIYDSHQKIAEEIGCLFKYNSNSGEGGKIQRTISVYDLQQNCNDCGHRGEYTDVCPKCGSTNIKYGYGDDTSIFVTSDELASGGIELTTDTDSVKNCFKLEAGDDLMTATVRNCNPNGSDYIWYFSNTVKDDMSDELVEKIESYDEVYRNYCDNYKSDISTDLLNNYNKIIEKYSLYNKELQKISTPITGYSSLMDAYYNIVDLSLYLKSNLMPSIEMSETNATEQAKLLTASSLSPVAVNTANAEAISLATADSAVLSMAKIIVKSTYKVEVKTSTLSDDKVWEGSFIITNYSDETDTAESQVIKVAVNNDTETFVRQKIEKSLNKDNTDDYSISGLFKKDYVDFCAELKKYALNPLKSFYDACDSCINILIDNGAGNKDEKLDLYEKLYEPYYKKSSAISNEIKIREDEIATIEGVWDKTEEGTPKLITKGIQHRIEECRNIIQNTLNFEKYLGKELWLEFCSYRREDKYTNENYISDGLNNTELFKRALEFIDSAKNEIYKSSELQHSISTNLNNLLAIDKFKPLVNSFKLGNWIRVQIDDKIYKLRLLEYGINFGSFDNIPVEFSDVTKIKNGITDVRSVINQASSMATSYSSVQRQANQGEKAEGTIEQWSSNGLNTALVRIQSNNKEEVTMTKNGLLCKSFDDITGSYLPEQLRITHNIMAYTDDNWQTVRQAIGKHDYMAYNSSSDSWMSSTGYGMSAEFVNAGQVMGSKIVGGEIYSSNYHQGTKGSATDLAKGTHINLVTGDFELGNGKIVYDGDSLTLSGVVIKWDNTNSPKASDIEGLEGYLDQLDSRIQSYSQTTDPSLDWTTKEEKAKHEGDLWFNSDNGLTKIWNGTSWETVTDGELEELAKSKSQIFTSKPITPYYVGDLWVQGSTGDIKHCIHGRESGSYVESDWVISSKYTDDTLAKEALEKAKQGIIDAAAGISLAGAAQEAATAAQSEISTLDSYVAEYLGLGGGTIIGENYVISPLIEGGYLNITNVKNNSRVIIDPNNLTGNNYIFQVHNGKRVSVGIDKDGNASFAGKITATSLTLEDGVKIDADKVNGLKSVATTGNYNDLTNKPTIPTSVSQLGLDTSKIIYKGDITQTNKTDANGIQYTETTVPSSTGTFTYSTYNTGDYIVFGRSKGEDEDGKDYFCISTDGLLTARNAIIYGTIYATDGEFAGSITGSTITIGDIEDINSPSFQVKKDGNTYIRNMTLQDKVYFYDTLNNRMETAMSVGDGGGLTFPASSYYFSSTDGVRFACETVFHKDIQFGAGSSGACIYNGGNIYINIDGNNVHKLDTDYTIGLVKPDSGIGRLQPGLTDTMEIGSPNYKWANIYATTSTIGTSDRNMKDNIKSLTDIHEQFFMRLLPVSFTFKDGTSGRTHVGFISQDVESAMNELGMTSLDFAGFCKDIKTKPTTFGDGEEPDLDENGNEQYIYSLRYGEFVALNTYMIQKLSQRISDLESQLKLNK